MRTLMVITVVIGMMVALAEAVVESRRASEYHISHGILTASEHELDAGGTGYFSVGLHPEHGTVLLVKTGGTPWLRLRELRGQKVTIVVKVGE